MINQKEITVEWLSKVSKKHRNVDKILTEKTIRALLLLEGLAKQDINFVFKDGNENFDDLQKGIHRIKNLIF